MLPTTSPKDDGGKVDLNEQETKLLDALKKHRKEEARKRCVAYTRVVFHFIQEDEGVCSVKGECVVSQMRMTVCVLSQVSNNSSEHRAGKISLLCVFSH